MAACVDPVRQPVASERRATGRGLHAIAAGSPHYCPHGPRSPSTICRSQACAQPPHLRRCLCLLLCPIFGSSYLDRSITNVQGQKLPRAARDRLGLLRRSWHPGCRSWPAAVLFFHALVKVLAKDSILLPPTHPLPSATTSSPMPAAQPRQNCPYRLQSRAHGWDDRRHWAHILANVGDTRCIEGGSGEDHHSSSASTHHSY